MRTTIEAFERHDVDMDRFDHEAHVYIAWLFVTELGAEAGTERFVDALKSLTRAVGAADKYHDTITRFYLDLIVRAVNLWGRGEWEAFRATNPALFDRHLLSRRYSRDLLSSDGARKNYVQPDRVPFDSAA